MFSANKRRVKKKENRKQQKNSNMLELKNKKQTFCLDTEKMLEHIPKEKVIRCAQLVNNRGS
jgi:hypothetical protein